MQDLKIFQSNQQTESSAERNCDRIVAQAAPATPIWKGKIKRQIEKDIQDRRRTPESRVVFCCHPVRGACWRSYCRRPSLPFRGERQTYSHRLRLRYQPESASATGSRWANRQQISVSTTVKTMLSSVETATLFRIPFSSLRAAALSEADAEAAGEAIDKAEYKINDNAGGPDCSK